MSSLRRKPGWQGDLVAYLGECEGRAFKYGTFDCAIFASDWVYRMTGFDAMAEHRGKYRTQNGAAKRLKKVAGGGVIEWAASVWGEPLPSIHLARRGDIVAVHIEGPEGPDMPALGIVDSTGVEVAVISFGLTRYPLSSVACAWAVG